MERVDFERNLCAKLEDIKALYRKYNPDAFNEGPLYLTMAICADGTVMANNGYWKCNTPDKKQPVHCWTKTDGEVVSYEIGE